MYYGSLLVELVAIASMVLYLYMGVRVGQARAKHGIKAPATTGHEEFERAFRVHQNTLEWMVIYLPSLFLFAGSINAYIAAGLGAVWIVGRYVYMEGYIEAAEKRSAGFGIQALATLVLLLGSLVGVVWKMLYLPSIF